MRLTFLGTGAAMPTGNRFQSGVLLEYDESTLLVDCGSGVLHALARTDVGYEAVDAVLLTHHHLDHLADLLPLCKARWLAGATELTIAGPPGTPALLEDLFDVHDYLKDRLDLTLRTVEEDFDIAGFRGEATEGTHSMQSFAHRLAPDAPSQEAGALTEPPSVVISGDTEADASVLELADGATVLVHDCSFPDDVDVSNHPTPTALGECLAAVDPAVDRIYLTHLYPHTEGRHEEMLDAIDAVYDGEATVDIAADGLTVQLGPRRA